MQESVGKAVSVLRISGSELQPMVENLLPYSSAVAKELVKKSKNNEPLQSGNPNLEVM